MKTHYTRQEYIDVFKASAKNEGYLNYYIYRRISLLFVWLAIKLGASANSLTLVAFILSISSGVLFFSGDYGIALMALLPFHLGKIIDCADGQLAKLTDTSSKFGGFIDPFLDRIVDVFIFTALSYWYFAQTGSYVSVWILIPLLTLWFIDAYLSKFDKLDSTTILKQSRTKMPSHIQKLMHWDGGFSGLIHTLGIIFTQIPALLLLHILVAAPATLFHFYRVSVGMKNEASPDED